MHVGMQVDESVVAGWEDEIAVENDAAEAETPHEGAEGEAAAAAEGKRSFSGGWFSVT